MVANVTQVLEQAMQMSREDRALLVQRLIASLEPDAGPDPGVDVAWQDEIQRRLTGIRSGTADMIPWETVREQLRKSSRDSR